MACAKVISLFEVLPLDDAGRRRGWTDEEKVRIVEESLRGHRQGSATARRYGMSRSLLTRWRKGYRQGVLVGAPTAAFSPVRISAEPPRTAVAPVAPAVTEKVEITLVNGRRLSVTAGIDAEALGRLLRVLESA